MKNKCEACNKDKQYHGDTGKFLFSIETEKLITTNGLEYDLCMNCMPDLINCSLTPEQFFNLIKNGHNANEFYLHSDFYDEDTGEALQPR